MSKLKKEMIKSLILVLIIIGIACISTYNIYNKFHKSRSIDYSSESLDITFHETTGGKITLDKVTPLNDNLGLTTNSYNFTIKNNLTEKVEVTIKIVDDLDEIKQDGCEDKQIPKDHIKISIKSTGMTTQIMTLTELENEVLLITEMEALEKKDFTIRAWTDQDIDVTDTDLHYHGLIQIYENNNSLARR